MKKILHLLFHRVTFVGLIILIQLAAFFVIVWRFQQYFVFFYIFSVVLSLLIVLGIINGKSNPSYKIAWIVPILLFPIFGGLFYLIFGGNRLSKREQLKMQEMITKFYKHGVIDNNVVLEEIKTLNKDAYNQSSYLHNYAHNPIYKNTYSKYLPLGEIKFEVLKEELRKAKHYIFLEYFIIEEGIMWDSILEILVEKANEGLDIRVMYDDIGCSMTLPHKYYEKLESMGIKCSVYNPIVPIMSPRINTRDHRKIAVIDGHTAFTGGINLADEYINAYEKHGHWKDTAIMIKGDAVFSFTSMFISTWDYIRNINENLQDFLPSKYCEETFQTDGYIQPFTDNPLDDEPVGQTIYLNLINKAKDYVYINTPYLIIDHEMVTALINASKAGVDVRIVTPHIGDKWYVHEVTRSYYETLVENGVRIYEYTPGFIHAKTFVVDDIYGVVGTINMDYRSLFLHMECGVWMYKSSTVLDMKQDYLKTLEQCDPVTIDECRRISFMKQLKRSLLRAFAPLM